MDKESLKTDFKNLINSLSTEVMQSSVYKLLEKLKKEISDLTESLANELKTFSKMNKDIPEKVDKKIEKFDQFQKKAAASIEKNNNNLKNEIDRMVDNNSKLEGNFNNNFYQLQENNDVLQKKVLDLTKLVNILIVIVAFSAIGIIITIFQNQKIISMKSEVIESVEEVPEEVTDLEEELPEEIFEGTFDPVVVGEDDLARISKNAKEINKIWNSFSKLNNRVKAIDSVDKLESKFETRFTSLENHSESLSSRITDLDTSFNSKLDNVWVFLEEKGTSKMKKAIGNIQD